MAITAEQRRQAILALVRERGTVRLADLAAQLGQAAVTIRRDVATLADDGLVRRSHGAVSVLAEERAATGERVVGVLVPTVDGYFDEVVDGANEVAARTGGRLVLTIADTGAAGNRAQVAQLLESGAEALLLTPDGDAGWIRDLPVPVVLVERPPPADSPLAELDSVASDHGHGVLVALRHFTALGHTSVLLAARSDTPTALAVRAGYAAGMPMAGLTAQPVVDIAGGPGGMAGVAAALAERVAAGTRAVLVHNDRAAIALPPLLRAHGLHLPDDIALISYDDVFARLAAPPLTAVAPPKKAVGVAAMELAMRRLRGGSDLPAHHIRLLPRLRVRTSCGAGPS
ncbi:LacI family transcriptional regulator [Longispora fulva]|uniref:DNA-binding LacI/PurR family transcriptional regulator n=1 Tax=Longispora fulva TaxID=619741 RepID=A0A8J7GI00_9ACTN|nr:substrate-binding domain-containing protein [Longispora fulva]MBG6137060.1 DNA-binding LacI/PurR family transcriptional regulator [Longispora fulva]GIG61586.1 LacI family transcriptional regulator [Longispora fulva]